MVNKRGIFLIFLAFSTLFCLFSCKSTKSYKDDLSPAELAEIAEEALSSGEFLSAAEGYLEDYLPLSQDSDAHIVCFSSDGNNLDEFGIWQLSSDAPEMIRGKLEGYLAESLTRNREFYDSYIPQETPKLQNAEVRVFGNYVVYAILNDRDRAIFFETIERSLSGSAN